MASQLDDIYEKHVKPLSAEERLQLMEMTAQDLGLKITDEAADKPNRSILELHGLGKEIWQGVDAQEYVNSLRNEWTKRP